MNKRKKVAALIGSGAAIAALYFIFLHFFYVSTDNAQIQARTLMLAPKISGYVVKVLVDENQKVNAGDILAEIDDRDYKSELTQAESEVLGLEARAKDVTRNYERISGLKKSGAVSLQQYDQAEALYRETVRKLEAGRAQAEIARLNLENTKIKAPTKGVIAKKSVEVGQLAPVGTPLFGFVSSDERWVVANFKETELRGVQPGKTVDVTVDALPGHRFHGVVESISPATGATFTLLPPDNATGNFTKVVQRVPVRIKLEHLTPEDIDLLQAGLSAYVSVHIR